MIEEHQRLNETSSLTSAALKNIKTEKLKKTSPKSTLRLNKVWIKEAADK